jgi:hypothetical protein
MPTRVNPATIASTSPKATKSDSAGEGVADRQADRLRASDLGHYLVEIAPCRLCGFTLNWLTTG